jgi:diacylglycerol kinase family enzyme
MRVHLLCNPASGGGTDDDAVSRALERHGATLTEPEEAERIVVSGGDGTVATGAELAAERGLPLALIPTGTANDFARATGLPLDPDEAAELAVTGAPGQPHDLAFMDGRPFVNVAAAGLGPAAARRAAPLKRLMGPLAYPAGAFAAGLLDDPLTVAVRPHFEGRAWQLIVAGTGAFGGGAEVEAEPGGLDLVVVPAGRRIALARYGLALRRGSVTDLPGVVRARSETFTVEVAPGTPFSVDGEVVRAGGPVRFTVARRAFRLVASED